MRGLTQLLPFLLPLLCQSQKCQKLSETLGVDSQRPPRNIRGCNEDLDQELALEGYAPQCSCNVGFKNCTLSLMIEGRDTRNNKEGTEDDEGEVIEVNQKKVLKKWLESDEDEEVEDEEEESLRHLQLDSGRCNFCCRVNTTNNNSTDHTSHNNHNNHNNHNSHNSHNNHNNHNIHNNHTSHDETKDKRLGTALTAGVMLGMILVVVIVVVVVKKWKH